MLVLFFDESNEKLFLYLHDKYKKLLYKYAYDILKNHYDAEEALQITWLKVANNIEKIKEQPERKKLNYLITIVKNVSINIYNSKKNIVAIDNDENLTEMMIDKYNDIYFTLELQDFKDAIKSINKEFGTQGINNKDEKGNIIHDATRVKFSDVIGKPILCINYLGYINRLIATPPGIYIVFMVMSIMILIYYILEKKMEEK